MTDKLTGKLYAVHHGDYAGQLFALVNKNKVSCTVGHSHLLDYAIAAKPSGKKIMGLSAGCYLTHREKYAYNTQRLWWSGLVVKRNVKGGEYDIETVHISEVKKRYGRRS